MSIQSVPAKSNTAQSTSNPFDPTWLRRLPAGDRAAVDALQTWLSPIEWELFCCFQFPFRAKPEQAVRVFNSFHDSLERSLRGKVGFVYAGETQSKYGSPVPLHIHAVLVGAKPLSSTLVSDTWKRFIGRSNDETTDLIDIRQYDPSRSGLRYIAKQIGEPDTIWDTRWIDYFNPAIPTGYSRPRDARRWNNTVQ